MKLLRKIFHLLFRIEIIPTEYVLKYRKWLERQELKIALKQLKKIK